MTNCTILDEVFNIVKDRKKNPVEGSYVCSLYNKGEDKILEKIGEETVEIILAAKGSDRHNLVWESADLIFHLMVLLSQKGHDIQEVYQEMEKRRH